MQTLRILLALIGLSSLAGCHFGAALDAVVVDGARSAGDKSSALPPLAGARASLNCPNFRHQLEPGSSDAAGHYRFLIEERYHRTCVLTVEQRGYQTANVVIGDVCPPHEDAPNALYCGLSTVIVVRMVPASP